MTPHLEMVPFKSNMESLLGMCQRAACRVEAFRDSETLFIDIETVNDICCLVIAAHFAKPSQVKEALAPTLKGFLRR